MEQGDHVAQKQTPLERNHWTPIEIAVKSISLLVLILLIVALGVDKLSTVSSGDAELACRWKELWGDDPHQTVSESWKKGCDSGSDKACEVETSGEVWLAFGILGIFAQTAAVVSMTLVLLTSDESIISKEAILRVAALGIVCLLVLIQWAVWQAKGCAHNIELKNDSWDMGPSMIVVILAWILSLIATALQVANTMSILRVSSAKQASADVEDGASIRS